MSQHAPMSLQTNIVIFLALLGLLVLTVAFAYLPLGYLALPVAFTIATIKAILILMYFMHVKFSSRLILLFATGATVWVVIMLVWTGNDYFTRDLLDIAGK
ncbi:MAG: cytochrome C oxidase subunit IV family protein [Isosphaeraceae bacterium]